MSKNNQVEELRAFDDMIMFRTTCECCDSSHDMYFDIEYDKEFEMMVAHFSVDCKIETRYGEGGWLSRAFLRLKATLRLLLTGNIKMNHEFIFRGEDQIEGMQSALKEAAKRIKKDK